MCGDRWRRKRFVSRSRGQAGVAVISEPCTRRLGPRVARTLLSHVANRSWLFRQRLPLLRVEYCTITFPLIIQLTLVNRLPAFTFICSLWHKYNYLIYGYRLGMTSLLFYSGFEWNISGRINLIYTLINQVWHSPYDVFVLCAVQYTFYACKFKCRNYLSITNCSRLLI